MRRNLEIKNSSPGDIPFLEQAIASGIAVNGLSYEIHEAAESRKRTGWLLKADTFQIFLFKSSPMLEAIIEALTQECQTNPGSALFVEIGELNVEGFEPWFDDGEKRGWTKSKKLNVLDRFVSTPITATGGRKKAP